MATQDEKSANLNFWLAVCWVAGLVLAVLVTEIDVKLEFVSDDVLVWIGQVLLPICLLVLSRVFGLTIVKQFGSTLSRKRVFWLTLMMSLIFIAFAIGRIHAAARANLGGLDIADKKLIQLRTLSNSGTTILIALFWPILSMLLDYLFPKSEPSTAPDNPISPL